MSYDLLRRDWKPRRMTDEEIMADGWQRIEPPEVGIYGTYVWRQDGMRAGSVIWK